MKSLALKDFAAFQEMARIVAAEMHKAPERKARAQQALGVAAQVGGFKLNGEEIGMCVDCKEWCEVGASCCGRGVYFEGGFVADREEDEE